MNRTLTKVELKMFINPFNITKRVYYHMACVGSLVLVFKALMISHSHFFSKLSLWHSAGGAILFPINLIVCQWQLNESLSSLTNELNEVASASVCWGAKRRHNTKKHYMKMSLKMSSSWRLRRFITGTFLHAVPQPGVPCVWVNLHINQRFSFPSEQRNKITDNNVYYTENHRSAFFCTSH